MTVVGTAEITVIANDSAFAASLEEGTAPALAAVGAEAEVAGTDAGMALRDGAAPGLVGLGDDAKSAGADASAALRDGMAPGLVGLGEDAEQAGEDAGVALGAGLGTGADGAYKDVSGRWHNSSGKFISETEATGGLAGAGLRDGLEDGTTGIEDDLGSVGKRSGTALSKGAESGLSGIKGMLGNLGVPKALLGGWGELGLAVVGVGALAVDLGKKMQSADAAIAVASGSSIKSATAIGNAFLDTAGKSEFSGEEQASAYAAVAGQLKSVEGHTLDVKDATGFMTAAGDLATATHTSLASATAAVAASMQSFQTGAKGAAGVSGILLEASNATGGSVTSVGAALDKVKTKLGGMSPPLGQLAGLLVDLTDHGETGRAAMTALSGTFTAFLKPASDVATATNNLKVTTDALPASLQGLAKQYQAGALNGTQLTKMTDGLSSSQKTLWSNFTTASAAAQTAASAQAKMGISATTTSGQLKPMSAIIGELHDQIKGMTTAQAIAKLTADGFSNASAKLVATVQAGPAAYDKATAAVTKAGAAHAAAVIQSHTLSVEIKTIKAEAEDWATKLGEKLMPILGDLMGIIAKIIPIVAGFIGAFMKGLDPIIKIVKAMAKTKGGMVILAGVAAAVLIPVLYAVGAAMIAALGPIGLIIAGIVLLIAGVGELIEHWSAVSKFFGKLWTDVKGEFDKFMKFIGPWGRALVEILLVVLTGGLILVVGVFIKFHKQIIGALEKIPHDIVAIFDGAIGWLVKAGKDIIHGLILGFEYLTPAGLIIKFHAQILSALEGAGRWLLQIGKDILHGLFLGFEYLTPVGLIYKFRTQILGALEGAGTWLLDVGKDIVKGLVKGIEDMADLPVKAIKAVAHGITGAAKSVLGIFSPSKVFADIGGNIPAGMEQGITGKAHVATAAASKLASAVTTAGTATGSFGAHGAGAGASGGSTITVAQGAFVIHVHGDSASSATAQAATQAVQKGFAQLGASMRAKANPIRPVRA